MDEINPSIRRLEKAILDCHQRRQSLHRCIAWVGLIMFGTLAGLIWMNGFDIRNWIYFSGCNVILFSGACLTTTGFLYFARQSNELDRHFEHLRKTLMVKINAGFCSCQSNCRHKEEFLAQMSSLGINLDY